MDILTERKLKNLNTIFSVLTPIVTLITISLATYITIRLAPLYENIGDLVYRVEAIEEDRKSVPEWRARMSVLEQKVNEDHDSIIRIENNVNDIRNFLLVK